MIKLIAGLGNPGAKYENTRHNLGFLAIDRLLRNSPALSERIAHSALLFETEKYGKLCKPLCYMNRSGGPIAAICADFEIQPEEVLIIYDDFALELGLIRVRARGTSGGHNGLQSVIEKLQTTHVPRIRLGIKTPQMDSWIDYVLTEFKKSENPVVSEMIDLCSDVVEVILEKGINAAMNQFNKKQKLAE
jgi:peptidyl-tRNA hydrolase, PTH1 family